MKQVKVGIKKMFQHTDKLFLFILRRERIRLPIWLLALLFITILTANAFTDLYQTENERQAIAETMKNPAMIAMVGPGFGLDNYTAGPMMAHQMLLFTAIVVGIMSILLTTYHTRADEEEGRLELVRSHPVGRLANIGATIFAFSGVFVGLALLIGFGLATLQIDSIDLQGSLLYGTALGTTGIFFTAVTLLSAQFMESARGTVGLSISILLLSYLVRAIGDVRNEILSWFSPFGWVVRTEVYVSNQWWPVLLLLGFSIVLIVLSFILQSVRDLESGLIPSKLGRTRASHFLKGPLGLALRLQRISIIAWTIGMFVLGASYGSVFGDLESFFSENETIRQLLTAVKGESLTEQFLSMLMSVISMICTIPPLLFILKMKGEEKANRVEHFISHAVSRTRVIVSYLFISLFFSAFMLIVSIFGLWLSAASVTEEMISFSTMATAGIVYLPAIAVLIGITIFFIGFAPKFTSFIWLYLGYSFFVVYLGGIMKLPEWLKALSPFGHIPQLPVEEFDALSITVLLCLAMVGMCFGVIGYNKRDLQG